MAKEYRVLPDTCSNFTMSSFDGLTNPDGSGFQFIVIQENPDVQEPWLCHACLESDCLDRKAAFND